MPSHRSQHPRTARQQTVDDWTRQQDPLTVLVRGGDAACAFDGDCCDSSGGSDRAGGVRAPALGDPFAGFGETVARSVAAARREGDPCHARACTEVQSCVANTPCWEISTWIEKRRPAAEIEGNSKNTAQNSFIAIVAAHKPHSNIFDQQTSLTQGLSSGGAGETESDVCMSVIDRDSS